MAKRDSKLQPLPPFQPRNKAQAQYYRHLRSQDLVFGIGPAGTGKTHITAQHVAEQLLQDEERQLVIIRPTIAVEDEDLGHLPGDLDEKMGPWVAPVLQELIKVAGSEKIRLWHKRIELCAIGYIRGRTFENAIMHVSEAQNLTYAQAKVIVTRPGDNCQLVIEGDPEQSDIGSDSYLTGLVRLAAQAQIPHGLTRFTKEDVVRSALTFRWVQAFANTQ